MGICQPFAYNIPNFAFGSFFYFIMLFSCSHLMHISYLLLPKLIFNTSKVLMGRTC